MHKLKYDVNTNEQYKVKFYKQQYFENEHPIFKLKCIYGFNSV